MTGLKRKQLETDVEAWLDYCGAEARKKLEAAFKDTEARGKAGIDQATFNGIIEDMTRSFLFGGQHLVLLTVCPQVKTSPTIRADL